MKIRVTGVPDEIDEAVEQLGEVFDVVATSKRHRCRSAGRLVRVYVEVRPR